MGVTKLSLDFDYDFGLVAVRSDAKESRIAWELEKHLDIKLTKCEDVRLEFMKGECLLISNLACFEDFGSIHLLKNKVNVVEGLKYAFLIPELKDFDYFLRLEECYLDQIDEIFACVRDLSITQYSKLLIVEDLKSKDNLLF